MDAERQKKWDAWAEGVAKRVFTQMFGTSKQFTTALTDMLKPAFKKQRERMDALELRIADLERKDA